MLVRDHAFSRYTGKHNAMARLISTKYIQRKRQRIGMLAMAGVSHGQFPFLNNEEEKKTSRHTCKVKSGVLVCECTNRCLVRMGEVLGYVCDMKFCA